MIKKMFDFNDDTMIKNYGNKPFIFHHSLQQHPSLQFDAIKELALRLPKGHVFYSSGDLELDDDFDNAHSLKPTGLTLEKTLEDFSTAKSYMYIRQPEIDAEYMPIFQQMKEEVEAFKGEKDPGMNDAMLYMFISSPNSVTPFHVDRYETLLTQISGSKTIKVWSPDDRIAVTDFELDSLFARVKDTEPHYKEGIDNRAFEFEMKTADALHIPFSAAHCVKTGPEVSIGLSIIFTTKASTKRSSAHHFNYKYRQLIKTEPRSVGISSALDASKHFVLALKQKASLLKSSS